MGLINLIKVKAFDSLVKSLSEDKLSEIIIDFNRRQFGERAPDAIRTTGDKMLRVGLKLLKEVK